MNAGARRASDPRTIGCRPGRAAAGGVDAEARARGAQAGSGTLGSPASAIASSCSS
jgi:hypothetical protein